MKRNPLNSPKHYSDLPRVPLCPLFLVFFLFSFRLISSFLLVEFSHSIRQPSRFQLATTRRTASPLRGSRVAGDLRQASLAQHGFVVRINVVTLHDILVMLR